MDDKRIETLVRMALEVEELERSIAGESQRPLARIGPRPGAAVVIRRLLMDVGIGVAAAACLTFGFLYFRPAPVIPNVLPGTGPRAPVQPGMVDPVVTAAKDRCVVLAMFRDPDGRCSCVQVREPVWEDQRLLADVPRSELRRVALQSPCSTDAEQVLIVAMEGRADSLPSDHQAAEVLAQGLNSAAASVGRHADVSSLAYTIMPKLVPGATVVAETVAMRQPSSIRGLFPDAPISWK